MGEFAYDRDISVELAGDGRFRGTLHERWTIGPVPNGGYVMALMLSAALASSDHADPLTATAHFLSPTAAGPVEAEVEVVKPGRSTTTAMVGLHQEGRERVRMLCTLGDMDARSGPRHCFLAPPVLEAPFETRRSTEMQNFPENFDFRIPVSMSGGIIGEPTGEAVIGGTMAFADGRPPDLLALPTIADGFPPTAFNLGHVAWTPTIELTVHFWNRPAPGPLTVWLESGIVEHGFHDESGDVWDSEGSLVARSRQLALILPAASEEG